VFQSTLVRLKRFLGFFTFLKKLFITEIKIEVIRFPVFFLWKLVFLANEMLELFWSYPITERFANENFFYTSLNLNLAIIISGEKDNMVLRSNLRHTGGAILPKVFWQKNSAILAHSAIFGRSYWGPPVFGYLYLLIYFCISDCRIETAQKDNSILPLIPFSNRTLKFGKLQFPPVSIIFL
jgi:hypothetical protein